MVEQGKLADGLIAPLVGRGEEPREGEDQPPEEGRHHGVVEQAEDQDAGCVGPRPLALRLHVFPPRTGHAVPADDQG